MACAAGGGALGLSIGWWQYTSAKDRLVSRLAGWIATSEDARILGRVYLASQPEEASREVLTELLSAHLDLAPFGAAIDGDLKQLYRARVIRDFAEANTLTIQGWILSRTELRLFGLASLLPE